MPLSEPLTEWIHIRVSKGQKAVFRLEAEDTAQRLGTWARRGLCHYAEQRLRRRLTEVRAASEALPTVRRQEVPSRPRELEAADAALVLDNRDE